MVFSGQAAPGRCVVPVLLPWLAGAVSEVASTTSRPAGEPRRRSSQLAGFRGWGLILALVLMGAALLISAWANDRGVDRASQTLIRGHGDVLGDGIRRRLLELEHPASSRELAAILKDFQDDGLLYVALLDAQGRIRAEAGTASESRAELERAQLSSPPGEPLDAGGRVRTYFGRYASGQDPNSGVRRLPWVIEYTSTMASSLRDTARWTFGLGAFAAAVLLIVAGVLVRLQLRRQAMERAQAQERRLASLGEMSAVLAHEIRNPLASLKGNGQVLVRLLPDDGKPRRMAERMVNETVRLEQLTNDLLEFARSGEIHRRDTDPVEIADEAARAVGAERVRVHAERAPRSWSVDPDRMLQVLINLLENAIQESERPVDVDIRQRGDQLEYIVRDYGSGIRSGDLERVFEPFYTGRIHGTGLGLAVARRLVRLHGGEVIAANATASDSGTGAVFHVSIPRS